MNSFEPLFRFDLDEFIGSDARFTHELTSIPVADPESLRSTPISGGELSGKHELSEFVPSALGFFALRDPFAASSVSVFNGSRDRITVEFSRELLRDFFIVAFTSHGERHLSILERRVFNIDL